MARRQPERDLVGLTVLALLVHGPKHPYELHRFIVDTHKDYVTGLPRSLYHAVDRLLRDELIAPVETSRAGKRPERTVYDVTHDGRAELAARLRRLLENLDIPNPTLVAAVSLLGCLPPIEVQRCLGTRAANLEGTLATLDGVLASQREAGMPRILLLEVECERAIRAAELAWVRGVLTDLRTGELDWSAPLKGPDLGATEGWQDLARDHGTTP
jgi:DNA-binding PadR family transcriptional regulator